MKIDSMFVYHFVDPDLRVEIIFRNEGTTENNGIDFEMGREAPLRTGIGG